MNTPSKIHAVPPHVAAAFEDDPACDPDGAVIEFIRTRNIPEDEVDSILAAIDTGDVVDLDDGWLKRYL